MSVGVRSMENSVVEWRGVESIQISEVPLKAQALRHYGVIELEGALSDTRDRAGGSCLHHTAFLGSMAVSFQETTCLVYAIRKEMCIASCKYH